MSFQCHHPLCGRAYVKKAGLTQHLQSHDEDRPSYCPDCDFTFARPEDYKRHHQVAHEGQRHKCNKDGCEKEYTRRYELTKHQNTFHGLCARTGEESADDLVADVEVHSLKEHSGSSKPDEHDYRHPMEPTTAPDPHEHQIEDQPFVPDLDLLNVDMLLKQEEQWQQAPTMPWQYGGPNLWEVQGPSTAPMSLIGNTNPNFSFGEWSYNPISCGENPEELLVRDTGPLNSDISLSQTEGQQLARTSSLVEGQDQDCPGPYNVEDHALQLYGHEWISRFEERSFL